MTRFEVRERGWYTYTATLLDAAGAPVPLSAVSVLTLTLYNGDTKAGGIINGRSKQDGLNANNVTLHATSGLLTWQVQPADVAIQNVRRAFERHVALFEFVASNREGSHEVELIVENIRRRP